MGNRFARELQAHLPAWVREGLLSAKQADAIARRHEVHEAGRGNRTVRVVGYVGGTLMALGIILWVASNWQSIPDAIRIMMLVALTGAAWGLAAYVLLRRALVPVGHSLLLVGGAAYGGTLLQVANTFNLPAWNGTLVALWILGLLPVGYVFRSLAVHGLALLLVPIWVVNLLVGEGDPRSGRALAAAFMSAGLFVIGTGLLHPRHSHGNSKLPPFQDLHTITGTLMAFLPAFVLTFFGENDLPSLRAGDLSLPVLLIMMAAAAAITAGLLVPQPRGFRPWRMGLIALPLLLMTWVLLWPLGVAYDFAYGIATILVLVFAVQDRHEIFFNLGLALFVVELGGRYVEFVIDLANAAIVFIVGGLILLALAAGLEALRRRMTPRLRQVVN